MSVELNDNDRAILESLDTVWEPLSIVEAHFRGNYVRSYQVSRRALAGRLRSLKARGLVGYRPPYGPGLVSGIGQWAITEAGDKAIGRL